MGMCVCDLEERGTCDAELVERGSCGTKLVARGVCDANLVEMGIFGGDLVARGDNDAELVEMEMFDGDLVEMGEIDDGLVMGMFDDDFGIVAVVDGEDSPFRSNIVTASLTFSTTPISPGVFLGLMASEITWESALSSSPGSSLFIRYSFTETPLSHICCSLLLPFPPVVGVDVAAATVRPWILEAIVWVASATVA